jgi:hypothetical protein
MIAKSYHPGDRVYDSWTGRYVTVVAGAQSAQHVTVVLSGITVSVRRGGLS